MEKKFGVDRGIFTLPSLRETRSKEWISNAHRAVDAAVFKILREKFGQAVVLGVGPKVGIIPGEPVSRHAHHCGSQHRFIWIKHRKLFEKIFGLTPCFFSGEQRTSRSRLGHRVDKFHYGLVRKD